MDAATAATRSRERVERAIADLEAEFGSFPVLDRDWPVDAATYADYVERIDRGTLGGAGAWVADEAGRVALVRDHGHVAWSEPSGHHEPGETLCETARREVREETGLEIELRDVGFCQHLYVAPEAGDLPTLHRVVLVFTARRVGGELAARPGEVADAAWFETRPEQLLYDELHRLEIPLEVD